jgi:hypothetical protein
VNLLEYKIHAIKKNTETSIGTSWLAGPEVKAEAAKHMPLLRHQNAKKNEDIKLIDRLFENVAQLKYLGTTLTNQNCIR